MPRVPKTWQNPKRASIEKLLRASSLQEFPLPYLKLRCLGCGTRKFLVWYDRVRCVLGCKLRMKIESGSGGDLVELKLPWLKKLGPDGRVPCKNCGYNMFYVQSEQMTCALCHKVHAVNPPLSHCWSLEELDLTDAPLEIQPSRSTIYRDLKKLNSMGAR